MKIRAFENRDKDEVISLWQCCGHVAPHNDPEKDIQRKLLVDPDLFLIGEIDSRITASVMVGYEGHRGWINYLAVLPEMQGKGYGREMMQVAEQRLRDRGCAKINLQVRASNQTVLDFYAALVLANGSNMINGGALAGSNDG